MITIGIDPGKNHHAMACVDGKQVLGLLWQPAFKTPGWFDVDYDRVVIESQYVAKRKSYTANDMIAVAFASGFVLAYLKGPHYRVPPIAWKGTAPKRIHQTHIIKKLSRDTLRLIASYPKEVQHNLIDAVGIALWSNEQEDLTQYRVIS